jgi:hypothetical protein
MKETAARVLFILRSMSRDERWELDQPSKGSLIVDHHNWHVLVYGFCRSTAESISWSIHGPIIVTEGSKARFW